MVKRAFEVELPFSFFLNNDESDFNHFLEWMTRNKFGFTFKVDGYEGRGERYSPYGYELNEWFELPDNVGGYQSDEPVWLLRFNVSISNPMRSG